MAAAPDTPAAGTAPPAAPSLWQSLQGLLLELPGLLSDRVELLSLELNRAGLALSQIVVLTLAAAVLAATAWLALWGGVLGLLVLTLGLHWLLALSLVLLLNLAGAGLAWTRARRLAALLALPATQRHLMVTTASPARPEPQTAPGDADGRAPA